MVKKVPYDSRPFHEIVDEDNEDGFITEMGVRYVFYGYGIFYERTGCLEITGKKIKNITDIKGLKFIPHLKRLKLYNNYISEIKGLEIIRELEGLDLSKNQITEIKGLNA